ncbi:MAG: deoxyribodipyrimidine photo-lyase [Silicimonas sp.]|nr:deoxyribodipyrimidine photo-lyase [Silicimonas sp.]
MQIVWLKRDLRLHDNRALARAAQHGDVLPLYVVEPELWRQPDHAGRHWAFVSESLSELRADLARAGQPLVVRTGDVIDVFEQLHADHTLKALWSHEETGNDWTFQRDKRVAAWCRDKGIVWHELQNHGVQRRLRTRDGWAKSWDQFMAEPITKAPAMRPLQIDPGTLPSARDLGLAPDPCDFRQPGGRQAGTDLLNTFLTERGETNRTAMSSPLAGAHACSRISPHLAWGTLSVREAAQATWARQRELKAQGCNTKWRASLRSYTGRLHWHCHFIQKLEDEPRIEFENLHRGYDGIRPSAPDQERLTPWARGETGLPFVDACMRSLRATGWLNFRMRAMVMATASYHLWLDWRAPGLELARLFTDYEPGIHWSQTQMQSGTTGINTIRIYNPVKQGHDQDPTGAFVRRWVPELAAIPDAHLQEPWTAENARDVLGKAYPNPIIDHLSAAKQARQRIWAVRGTDAFRAQANSIQAKHGSRKSGNPNRGRRPTAKKQAQLSLPLD